MDLAKKLPLGVWVQGRFGRFYQKVEYEGITHLCFHCGVVGHKVDACPTLHQDSPHEPISRPNGLTPPATVSAVDPGMDPDVPPSTDLPSDSLMKDPPVLSAGCRPNPPPMTGVVEAVDAYGPWTLVARRQSRNKRRDSHLHPSVPGTLPPFVHGRGSHSLGIIGPRPGRDIQKWRPPGRGQASGGSGRTAEQTSTPISDSGAQYEYLARTVAHVDQSEDCRSSGRFEVFSGGDASPLVPQ